LNDHLADLIRLKPSAETLDAAERGLQEARQCCDKVRRLAPRDTQARIACLEFSLSHSTYENGLDAVRGQPVQNRPSPLPDLVQDTVALADLCPENINIQALAATVAWTAALVNAPQNPGHLPTISPQDRLAMEKYLDRLTRGTGNANPEAAAFCHKNLALLYADLSEWKLSEKHAGCAVDLDANAQECWEFLIANLFMREKVGEALELARSCVKRCPNCAITTFLPRCSPTRGS